MKYVCLVYQTEGTFAGWSEDQLDAMRRDAVAFDDELAERGHLVYARALDEPETALTLRIRDGKLSATDGPFAETTEYLAGFTVIESRDLNEALSLAERHPLLRYATIELRPMWNLPDAIDAREASATAEGGIR